MTNFNQKRIVRKRSKTPKKEDILASIAYYERRQIEDPEGRNLYESMIQLHRKDLERYE